MRAVIALLALLLLQDHAVDAASWEAVDSSVKVAEGVLAWEAKGGRSALTTRGIPEDLRGFAAIAFRASVEGEEERALVVGVAEKAARHSFWRKLTVKPGEAQAFEVKLWQFRTSGIPSWGRAARLAFGARDAGGSFRIEGVRLVKHAGGGVPFLEPEAALQGRAFGGESSAKATANFRVFTDAPLDLDKLGGHLEAMLKLFQKTFGLKEAPLDYPATLVVAKTPEAYRAFVKKTVEDVYAGLVAPPTSTGLTFEQYACTSWDEKLAERRPVFFHESCHLLIPRLLGFRGPDGATWVEEGICYWMQYEFMPSEPLSRPMRALLANARRPKLSTLAGTAKAGGMAEGLGLAVVDHLIRGPHAAKLGAVLEALRPQCDLPAAVKAALGLTIEEFEAAWLEWATGRYKD